MKTLIAPAWLLLCAVPPATQIEWTVPVFAFATLLFFGGLYFGVAIEYASRRMNSP